MAKEPSNEENENQLNRMWQNANKKINRNRNLVYFFLGSGIVLQVIFFSVNIFVKNNKDLEPIKVEIVGKAKSDTSPHSTTVIRIK